MSAVDPMIKENLYAITRDRLVNWYGEKAAKQARCLYWAQVTMRTLLIAGLEPVLQAGDMLWPIVDEDQDDGGATHFGYEWSPERPESAWALNHGLLPEIHCWVGLPSTGEIVDFSTSNFVRIATDESKLNWRGAHPPKFLWGQPPPRTIYRPVKEATLFVWQLLMKNT
jgi:hypothetical protein